MKLDVTVPQDGVRVDVQGLELPPGDTTVIFGPNGAGKTTLLRRLAGLDGPPILKRAVYLQQRPYMFRGTAGFNLGLGLGPEEAARARQMADSFGVGGLLESEAQLLSGGERQRLGLARTLAFRSDWLLLDEPLAPIDRADRDSLLALLSNEFEARSVVLVTHDIKVVAALADQLVIIDRGRLLEQGEVASVIGSPTGVRSAEILGTANLIDGFAAMDDGLCVLMSGSVRIAGVGDVEGPARALFGAETITLRHVDSNPPTSARNTWVGRVETILHRGQLVEVAVDIGVRLVAVVTPGGLSELELEPGGEVGVSVKASAVRIVAT